MQQINKRIPHIMTDKKGIHHPSNFFFFDTETYNYYVGEDKDIEQQQLWFGCVWAFRYEDGRYTRQMKETFKTIDGFYELVHKRIDKCRPLYILAHNLGFDLPIVDFLERSEALGMDCTYAILESSPTFLSMKWHGCKIIIIDTFNFWKCGVADMGRTLGLPKIEIDIKTATFEEALPYCQRDVEIIARMVTGLLDFLSEHDLGSFGITAPSIAMNTYKKRFMKHDIFIHDRLQVLQLERQSYYGGLVNNFYIGKSTGETLYHTDVNSLYPSVMLNRFPTKMVASYKDIKYDKRIAAVDGLGFIGDVQIDTQERQYPMRYGQRLCEVRGRYRTQLAGIELAIALSSGHVKHIYQLAAYETEYIFKDYIEFFWALRQRFSQPKGNPKEQLIKLLMNSLYGKFGQNGFQWKEFNHPNLEQYYAVKGIPFPVEYEKGIEYPVVVGNKTEWTGIGMEEALHLRYLAGKLEMKFPTGEHTESFCGIAAFVTSYARERLRQLITIAGPNNTYYCDTDSLFTNKVGFVNLCRVGEVQQGVLGKLKLEGQSNQWSFFGPKDYQFGDKTVLKGIKKTAKLVGHLEYEQVEFEGLKSILNRGGQPYVEVRTVHKKLSRKYSKGLVTKSGWTLPFTLSE